VKIPAIKSVRNIILVIKNADRNILFIDDLEI